MINRMRVCIAKNKETMHLKVTPSADHVQTFITLVALVVYLRAAIKQDGCSIHMIIISSHVWWCVSTNFSSVVVTLFAHDQILDEFSVPRGSSQVQRILAESFNVTGCALILC